MTQDLLSYWKPQTADANLEQGGLLNHAASNQYHRVHARDTVWIVTVRTGELRLLGRIHVGQVTDGAQAAKALGTRVYGRQTPIYSLNLTVLTQFKTSRSLPLHRIFGSSAELATITSSFPMET